MLRVAMPEMKTDVWLLEMQIFLSPRGLDLTHVLGTKLILTYCACVLDGGGTNKPGLFSLNEKGKEINSGLLFLSWH